MLLSMSLGPYWIDPNGGCVKDAIEVWCQYSETSCQTCVDPTKKVRCYAIGDYVMTVIMATSYH